MTSQSDWRRSPAVSKPDPPVSINGYGRWNDWKHWHHDQRIEDLYEKYERVGRIISMPMTAIQDHWPKVVWAGALLAVEHWRTGSWLGVAEAVNYLLTSSGA